MAFTGGILCLCLTVFISSSCAERWGSGSVRIGEGGCSSDSFSCDGDGVCMPVGWLCDDATECFDGSDEEAAQCHEPTNPPPPPTTTTTTTTTTTPACEDDEPAPTCQGDYFPCANGSNCFPSTWRCDGDNDCSDASDEQGC